MVVDYLNKLNREICEKYETTTQEYKDFRKFYDEVVDLLKFKSENGR